MYFPSIRYANIILQSWLNIDIQINLAILAQLVERVAFNHVVVGSIPTDGECSCIIVTYVGVNMR